MKKLCIIFLLALISCSKEDPVEETELFFEINKTVLHASHVGREFDLTIESNANWEIISHPEWLTTSSMRGEGNSELTVNILEHIDGEPRTGELVFQYTGNKHRLRLTQEAASLRLISYSGYNSSPVMDEPKYLLFNKPVNLNYIMSGEENLSFLIKDNFEYFNNRRGIKFTAGPSQLGSELGYMFSVVDDDNNKLEGIADLKFYTQKINFPGEIRKVILDDENNLWVLSIKGGDGDPSHIFKFSEKDGLYEQELKFEIGLDYSTEGFLGGDFVINPYNDLVYVPNWQEEKIEVYSKNGDLVKEIIIEPGNADHPEHPHTNPFSIGFIKSGKGIIALSANDISGLKWRFIDSSNNDAMTEPVESHNYYYGELQTFQPNHDNSKLYVLEGHTSILKVFDGGVDLKEINLQEVYPNGADAVSLSANKLNNKLYVAGNNSQQIISDDLTYLSDQTYGQFHIGDFSYDPSLQNHIYALNLSTDVTLKLHDYNNQSLIFEYPVNQKFYYANGTDLLTTTNDKFVVIYGGSEMVIFDTEMFK